MAFIQVLESQNFQARRMLEITWSNPLMLQKMGLRNREIHELHVKNLFRVIARKGHGSKAKALSTLSPSRKPRKCAQN